MGKKIVLSVAAVFLAFMAVITVYAQYRHKASLPVVRLGIARQYNEYALVVPATAIFQDGIGDCLWMVKETQGPWGKEYVTEKRYISMIQVDGDEALFTGTVDKPIVIDADGFALADDQAVRFKSE